jgi:hypothetical protein
MLTLTYVLELKETNGKASERPVYIKEYNPENNSITTTIVEESALQLTNAVYAHQIANTIMFDSQGPNAITVKVVETKRFLTPLDEVKLAKEIIRVLTLNPENAVIYDEKTEVIKEALSEYIAKRT